jgi:hypothetical protein
MELHGRKKNLRGAPDLALEIQHSAPTHQQQAEEN